MPELQNIAQTFSRFMITDILDMKKKCSSDKEEIKKEEQQMQLCEDNESDNDPIKKSRQCFNANQIEELEKLFVTTNYPDTLTRQQLATKMKVSESRIQIWFQNRRAKIRRQKKNRNNLHRADMLLHCQSYSPFSNIHNRHSEIARYITAEKYIRQRYNVPSRSPELDKINVSSMSFSTPNIIQYSQPHHYITPCPCTQIQINDTRTERCRSYTY